MIHKVLVPKSGKVNLFFTVPDDYVGEEMEVIAFIKKEVLIQSEQAKPLSPALHGSS